MPGKKIAAKKSKIEQTARGRRNPEGVSRVWGDGDSARAGDNGNGTKTAAAPRRRNPAPQPEESEDERKARELTLVAWKHLYAKRERFGKVSRG